MTKPPDLADLEEQIERLSIEKDEAVKNADYERAAELRDQAEKLAQGEGALQQEWRERMNEIDGVVDEEVIAEVVSKMTGVPLTRLEKEEAERLLAARGRAAQDASSARTRRSRRSPGPSAGPAAA